MDLDKKMREVFDPPLGMEIVDYVDTINEGLLKRKEFTTWSLPHYFFYLTNYIDNTLPETVMDKIIMLQEEVGLNLSLN